jgi:hypothetical protein
MPWTAHHNNNTILLAADMMVYFTATGRGVPRSPGLRRLLRQMPVLDGRETRGASPSWHCQD